MNKNLNIAILFSSLIGVLFMTFFSGYQFFTLGLNTTDVWRFWFLLIGLLVFLIITLTAIVFWTVFFIRNKNKEQSS